jgi:hypothetical protein
VAALRESGRRGAADGRGLRAADPLGGVDERWLAMCREVLAEHTEASRPTQELVLRRISARLANGHGQGTVPEPGRRRARAVLAELSRGTNAFTGSAKGKRSMYWSPLRTPTTVPAARSPIRPVATSSRSTAAIAVAGSKAKAQISRSAVACDDHD